MTDIQDECGDDGFFSSDYLDLIRRLPLRPIRSDEELDRAIAMIDSLLPRVSDGDETDEADYLDVLATLVHDYEQKHHPIPDVSGAEMLRYLIEARGTTQAELTRDTGIAASTISAILSGRRGMNRKHIEALARHFRVKPAVFLPG